MLHTIISETDIFPPEPIARPAFYPRGSGGVECRETADGPVIESLISTNPFDYLNPSFAPGRIYISLAARHAYGAERIHIEIPDHDDEFGGIV